MERRTGGWGVYPTTHVLLGFRRCHLELQLHVSPRLLDWNGQGRHFDGRGRPEKRPYIQPLRIYYSEARVDIRTFSLGSRSALRSIETFAGPIVQTRDEPWAVRPPSDCTPPAGSARDKGPCGQKVDMKRSMESRTARQMSLSLLVPRPGNGMEGICAWAGSFSASATSSQPRTLADLQIRGRFRPQ